MVNSQQIFTSKVLLGNRILYAEYDIDAMNNMLICRCCPTDWLLVLTVMHVLELLSAAYNAILSTKMGKEC